MARHVIQVPDAPDGRPYYSQAVVAGGWVFVSGTIGTDPTTGTVAGPSIGDQTRQAIANCRTVLHAAGADLADVVQVHVLLADPDDAAGFNEEYATYFPEDPPARSISRLGVSRPGVLVSVAMTAILP